MITPRFLKQLVFLGFGLLPVLGGLLGCGSAGRPGELKRLTYGSVVSVETASDIEKRTAALKPYLQSATGLPVNEISVVGYEPMIEAMCAQKVDLAVMGPFEYVIASSKGCGEVIATRGDASGQPTSYHSLIAVIGDSPIKTMQDLKTHSHDVTFAFTDPASTSGHLVPRAGLLAMGIDPEKGFKKVMFGMGQMAHLQTALMLKSGKVDAAAMMDKILVYLKAQGKLKPGELRVLWTSTPIPSEPIVVRKGLSPELKAKLANAFTHMETADPKLVKLMNVANMSTGDRYVPVSDSLFDPLRKMARNVPNLNLLQK